MTARSVVFGYLVVASLASAGVARGREAESLDRLGQSEPSPPPAPARVAMLRSEAAHDERDWRSEQARRARALWRVSAEAVTHAPLDVGFQIGAQTPFGLRAGGGFGWVPSAYSNLLKGVAISAVREAHARTVLRETDYGGYAWRLQAGFQPFKQVGLYLDGGYAHAHLEGATNLSDSSNRDLASVGGAYVANTDLDLWLIELGYQAQINQLVLGAALGMLGTFHSSTQMRGGEGTPAPAVFSEVEHTLDRAFTRYGYVPTFTLRVGWDLL